MAKALMSLVVAFKKMAILKKFSKEKSDITNKPGKPQYEELFPIMTGRHCLRKGHPSTNVGNLNHLMKHLKQSP